MNSIPAQFKDVVSSAWRALGPVRLTDNNTQAPKDFLFSAKRSKASDDLPPYYLVYFLFVDLLGFKNLGRFEKIDWSIPIDFNGRAFLVEHRKFGVGVFVQDLDQDEPVARDLVIRIQKATKSARPFFDWLADEAVAASAVNVINNSSSLFDRYKYLAESYKAKVDEAERRKDERITEKSDGWTRTWFPATQLRTEAAWLAMSAIEAFFSWTEHVFIHLAIISGGIASAQQVAVLAEADWSTKYRAALDVIDPSMKRHYDHLVQIRKELRNYVAHGAFGKQGEAFTFHSGAGAVPVVLPHRRGTRKFTFGHGLSFSSSMAMKIIDAFIIELWSGSRAPAKLYIQDSHLPMILTMNSDGSYARAMVSAAAMKEFIKHLCYHVDQAENMDW